jgi:hypothetical protein
MKNYLVSLLKPLPVQNTFGSTRSLPQHEISSSLFLGGGEGGAILACMDPDRISNPDATKIRNTGCIHPLKFDATRRTVYVDRYRVAGFSLPSHMFKYTDIKSAQCLK